VLLEQNPLVAQVVQAPARKAFGPAGALRALRALRAERYDVALDFQGLWKSAAWARLSGARRVVGWDRDARREPGSAVLLSETHARSGRGPRDRQEPRAAAAARHRGGGACASSRCRSRPRR
jgi:ADP-heptose:LPS heptosyltransferase